jgi:hypothetical protein
MNIGNRVKAMLGCDGKTSVQFEVGKIIYMGHRALVEFDRNICGHDGNGIGAKRKCWMMDVDKIKVL